MRQDLGFTDRPELSKHTSFEAHPAAIILAIPV